MARITNDLSFNAPRRSSADGRNPGANCTNCNALYHLIKAEGGPETVDRNLNCQSCGAPLPARDCRPGRRAVQSVGRSAHRQPLSARQRLWACANPRQHSGWPLPPLRSADTFAAALRRLCQKQYSRSAVVERRHASTPHAVSHGPAAIIAP